MVVKELSPLSPLTDGEENLHGWRLTGKLSLMHWKAPLILYNKGQSHSSATLRHVNELNDLNIPQKRCIILKGVSEAKQGDWRMLSDSSCSSQPQRQRQSGSGSWYCSGSSGNRSRSHCWDGCFVSVSTKKELTKES